MRLLILILELIAMMLAILLDISAFFLLIRILWSVKKNVWLEALNRAGQPMIKQWRILSENIYMQIGIHPLPEKATMIFTLLLIIIFRGLLLAILQRLKGY